MLYFYCIVMSNWWYFKCVKCYHRTPLVRWSLHKYKCLWDVGAKVKVQVSWKELHTYIYLDYIRVEFLSCIKKKKMCKMFTHALCGLNAKSRELMWESMRFYQVAHSMQRKLKYSQDTNKLNIYFLFHLV